jgi:hypothetical protein
MTEIILVQNPIIKHDLVKVGRSVTERLSGLNLENQIATDKTIKSLKDLRAELNKELADYENQRKAIKAAVLNPYNELEDAYKTEVSGKYKKALDTLKDKITEFENRVKADKEEEIKSYFVELVLAEEIDFLSFPQVGVKIDLSTSMKKYREQVDEFISRVKSDLALIDTQSHKAEILVEYKRSLNVSQAITTITSRKEAEKAEADRIKAQETSKRVSQLQSLAFIFHDITKTYNFVQDESLMISLSDVENLSKEEFNVRIIELSTKVAEYRHQEVLKAPEEVKPQAQAAPAERVVQAPEMFTATFEATGTYAQLKGLGEYMKSQSITYKNIE